MKSTESKARRRRSKPIGDKPKEEIKIVDSQMTAQNVIEEIRSVERRVIELGNISSTLLPQDKVAEFIAVAASAKIFQIINYYFGVSSDDINFKNVDLSNKTPRGAVIQR